MTGNGNDNLRPFPTTSDRADELLRARTRRLPQPVPLPPRSTPPAAAPGYPVPPRRKVRPVDPRPSARQLALRDWFLAGLVLGGFAGAGLTMLFVFFVLLWG